MDSHNWDDMGDHSLWFGGNGWVTLLIAIIAAGICYAIASAVRTNENADCTVQCGTKATPVVVETNSGMTCHCQWSDGSLRTGPEP